MTLEQAFKCPHLMLEARRPGSMEERAEELVREKEAMEHLDRFNAGFMLTVAHELRSPVSSG